MPSCTILGGTRVSVIVPKLPAFTRTLGSEKFTVFSRFEQFKSTQNFDGPVHRRQHGFAT
jgi:hypothetical protein